MHFRTHVKRRAHGARRSTRPGRVHRRHGRARHAHRQFLDKLDELGIADNTIVFYSTDNGPHYNTWPDAAATPFRGEKNTNWEGGWRVPAMVRWPGKIPAGSVDQRDRAPHGLAADLRRRRRRPDIKERLKQGGVRAIGRDYKVHLDGYNILPLLTGETDESPRKEIFYFSDDGDLTALRYDDWKLIFMEQRAEAPPGLDGALRAAARAADLQPAPRPLRARQITSNTYYDWLLDRAYLLVPAQAYVGQFLATFKEFPPRQKAASFSLDR
jgi:hypothetical protein